MPQFPGMLDLFLPVLLIGALLIGCFFRQQWVGILTVLLFVVLLLQDQMRWQPWSYHYLLFLLPFCFSKENKVGLYYFQLILVAIYLWGGIHKLNFNYFETVFPRFFFDFTAFRLQGSLKLLGLLIPITEIAIGLGLLFKWTRKWAMLAGIGSHLFILIWLSPIGAHSNTSIIPWNLAMIVFLVLCFYQTETGNLLMEGWKERKRYLTAGLLVLVFVFPVLNFGQLWDHYLSFNMYSGKNNILYVAIEENELEKLPYNFQDAFIEMEGLAGGKIININQWAMNELNVPVPPEDRIFKEISRLFCGLGIPPDKMSCLVFEQPVTANIFKAISCKEIQ